ncbi:class I SAM-dependent methyltransferase [Kiritimatiella glycovorans]|uniref:Multifunctional cyclase-dehydratase-3-O-methyl transferase TcmN n=1 Tax=Kiritimatiella glycovorans TaxID=1307763 RepID=A0A0G3EL26_9BACT|nr:class I SAM-dependent methyltransferase [Kiritimatiella glycovorans]AKJ64829.1 Multifunctional cyclase-dehydratase-3-O-methyl transferase TcmN [Kiritimatiella glycovorans]
MKKSLPSTTCDSSALLDLPYEAVKWELLKTAIELNLFDRTVEPATADEIAGALALHPANTEYVLNALVALGCLTKANGRFQNTPRAEALLASGKKTSLGAAMLYMAGWNEPLLNGGLKKLLQDGPPPREDLADPAIWEQGARAGIALTRAGRAQRLARLVAALPEFPSFTKILDMGAGPGLIGIAVTAAHPSLQCVVFDQPPVAKVAEEVVAEYGMGDRVTVEGGDYMTDDFGTGYEFVMANFTLNFYRDRLGDIMRKVLDALTPGGVFMVTSDGMSVDGTAPAASVISWLSTKVTGHDMSFLTGQVARAMLDAGFVSTEMRTLTDLDAPAFGPVEMTIGRKGS